VQSILKNLFTTKVKTDVLHLGRHIENYKSKSKYQDWDDALDLYNKKDFFGSVLKLLSYLNYEEYQNVIILENIPSKIRFKIYQGSKCVNGFANEDGFFCEVKIVHCTEFNKELSILLLQNNYELQYSCFSLDSDDNICMNFFSDVQSASPYKLYYGLKEIATVSDKNDDVFLKKYHFTSPIVDGQIVMLSDKEKNIKLQYFKEKLSKGLNLLTDEDIKLSAYPALQVYVILGTVLTIDYLLKPEGLLMEEIEKIYSINFNQSNTNFLIKIKDLKERFYKLNNLRDCDILDELYNACSTFSTQKSNTHAKMVETIEQEMIHYDWYRNNGFQAYAIFIPLFIASNLLYQNALPLPDKLYLELLIRIIENDFFIANDYKTLIDKNGHVIKKEILNEIHLIEQKCDELFEDFKIDYSKINFSNLYEFLNTYLSSLTLINPKRK
jgi:hypothetical protein